MLLIYSHTTSPRLQYICRFIFEEQLGIPFSITIDSEAFIQYEGPKINYSDREFNGQGYHILNHPLLFEEVILQQATQCFFHNGQKAFFKTGGDHPFDVLAASFYLISRYEEYLPHTRDSYGRFGHENALAYKEGFLAIPLVNNWINDLAEKLKLQAPTINKNNETRNFIPTYDIDMGYSYRHKGLLRNAGGFFRNPSLERIKVLSGLQPDPFDAYAWLNALHAQYRLDPVYFFLVAERNKGYDKNILPHKDIMWKLVKQHAAKYAIGLHPSWQSGDEPNLLKKEKNQLEAMTGQDKPVTVSRQHYIRFNLPGGYRRLINAGITDDHSMGYGSINGFRASVASPFWWYDLDREEQTGLRIHPFCFMEANSYYEQKQTAGETFDEMMHYLHSCRAVNGTMISIWHNNFLGSVKSLLEWKEIYRKFIEAAS